MAAGLDRLPGLVAGSPPSGAGGRPARVRSAGVPGRDPDHRHPAVTVARSVAVGLLAAAVLAGCTLDESGSPAEQMTAWLATSVGGAAVGQVEVDARNVDRALSRHEPASAVKTVCALLTTDAETAIGNLPTPDTQTTDDLNTAYEDAAAAGNDCYNGAGGSAAVLRRSAAERTRLVPLLTTALDRMTSIIGRTPSTSTTLAPADNNDPFGG